MFRNLEISYIVYRFTYLCMPKQLHNAVMCIHCKYVASLQVLEIHNAHIS